MSIRPGFILLLLTCVASVPPSFATWSADPFRPVEVVDAPNVTEQLLGAVPDGRSGFIAVWLDSTAGLELRAQRLDAFGQKAWGPNGVLVEADFDAGEDFVLASDRQGGLVVAWSDDRSGFFGLDVYAQRVGADGAVLWNPGGVLISGEVGDQSRCSIAIEESGGVWLAWTDGRISASQPAVFVQRLDASGNPQLLTNGQQVGVPVPNLDGVEILVDDAGGARAFWAVFDRVNFDHLDSSGVGFAGGPRDLFTTAGVQLSPERRFEVVGDGTGGFWLAWEQLDGGSNAIDRAFFVFDDVLFTESPSTVTGAPAVGWTIALDTRSRSLLTTRLEDVGGGQKQTFVESFDALYGTGFSDVQIPASSINSATSWDVVSDGAGGVWYGATLQTKFVQRVRADGSLEYPDFGLVAGVGPAIEDPVLVTDLENGLLFVFETDTGIAATRVDRHGGLGHPRAVLTDFSDVPGDQGGAVLATWTASDRDVYPETRITEYSVWRRSLAIGAMARTATDVIERAGARAEALGFDPEAVSALTGGGFEPVGSVPAAYLSSYSLAVPTYADSTLLGPQPLEVVVLAHTADPFVFWQSNAEAAQSTDDLAPDPPSNLTVASGPAGTRLDWAPSSAPDLAFYRVFRGATVDFETSPASVVAELTQLTWTDTTGDPGTVYKLVAVDDALNESIVVSQAVVTSVPEADRPVLRLNAPQPNPFNPRVTIEYTLNRPTEAHVVVYDLRGRKIKTLQQGDSPAGSFTVVWNGVDETGARVASGTYLVVLRADGVRDSRRVSLVK